MLNDLIRIQPAPGQRRAFARWAVAQTPKLRTVSPSEFAVPAGLFVDAPEEVLIGALVDGHRYVSPVEDAADGRPEPGTAELLGVATADGLTASTAGALPGQQPAPVPSLHQPAADAPAAGSGPSDPGGGQPGSFPCPAPDCRRDFPTPRGRDLHHRQIHPAEERGNAR